VWATLRSIAHLGIDTGPPVDIVAAVHCPRVPADAVPDHTILLMRHETTECTVELMPDGDWYASFAKPPFEDEISLNE